MASVAIRITSETLVKQARAHAAAEARTLGRQIEFWAELGRMALENPDIPVEALRGMMIGREQEKLGMLTPIVLKKGGR